MKNFFICALFAAALCCAADDLIYSCGFEPEEGFSTGKIVGQEGWNVIDGNHSYDSVYDVTNRTELVKSGSQALTMRCVTLEGSENEEKPYVGVNFDIEGGVENKYVIMSGDFLFAAGKDSYIRLNFANTREAAMIKASGREGFHKVKLGYTEIISDSYREDNVHENILDDTYCHIELVLDPSRKAIVSCSVDDAVMTNTASRMMGYKNISSSKEPIPNRIALECDLSCDNLKIETKAAEHQEAKLMLSKTGLYIDSEKNSAEFNINNTGSDPFDFTVSADESPEWLTIEPAEGSCSASQKITLSVDREKLTGDGYHKTLLTVNAGAAGSKKIYVGVASGKILMDENFEEPYMLPGEISGQGGWAGRKGDDYGKPYNEMIVTNAAFGYNGAFTHILRAGGWSGYTCEARSPEGEAIKVSLMLRVGSDGDCDDFSIREDYWNNCAQFQFRRVDDKLRLYKFNDANKYMLAGEYGAPLDEWIPFSFTIDLSSYLLTSLTFGDYVTNYAEGFALWNAPNERVNPVLRYDSLCVNAGGSGTADAKIFLDDLKVELTEKSSDSKLVLPSDPVYVEKSAGSVTFQVRNTGTTPFDFTVSAANDPEWLTIEPKEGSCDGSTEVTLSLDRSIMTNGFYKTVISVDAGAAGQKSFFLFAPSGSVIMYEDFEPPYIQPGEITGQGLWDGKKDDGYGQPYNEMLVENVDFSYDGACAHLYRGTGWDGYTLKAKFDKQALVRVSLMVYFGSNSDEESFYIRENYWGNCAQFQFKRHDDHFNLYRLNEGDTYTLAGEHAEYLDEWVPFSFTLDYKAYKLTSVTFGSFTTNYAEGMTLWNAPNDRVNPVERYEYFDVTCGGSETEDAALYLDNILIEQIERPNAALPIWTKRMNFGADLSSLTNKVANLGSVDFNYSLRFTDDCKGLSVAKDQGTGSQDGTVIIKLDRSAVDDGFHRAYLVMDYKAVDGSSSGSLSCYLTFSQGGWFYTSEFEGTGYELGLVNGQDTWSAYTWGTAEPSVALKDGLQCLYFPYDSSATSAIMVAPETPYRTSLRFYLEKNKYPYEMDLTASNSKIEKGGNLPFCVVYDPDKNKAIVGYKNAGDDEVFELCDAPVEQWNELSFVLDTDIVKCCADSLTLNDYTTNFFEGQVVLNPAYDSAALDQFDISAYCLVEDDHVGVYVDNLVICDANIPEPVCLTLILAMAALLSASKN